MSTEQWWHVYGNGRRTLDLDGDGVGEMYMTVVIPSHLAPDEPNKEGITPRSHVIPDTVTRSPEDAVYLASFDHSPTDEEMEALAPKPDWPLAEMVEKHAIVYQSLSDKRESFVCRCGVMTVSHFDWAEHVASEIEDAGWVASEDVAFTDRSANFSPLPRKYEDVEVTITEPSVREDALGDWVD